MPFLNIPIKSIQVEVTSSIGIQTMPWYDPQDFPVQPPDPMPPSISRDFRWRLEISVTPQPHSSYITRYPGIYNGQDISVGQWIANSTTGQAWEIISVESKTSSNVTAIVQDVYRYNTFRDPQQSGDGSPISGVYIVFQLGENGFPQIDPVPEAGISSTFTQNLQSRFEYINLQNDYPLYQEGNNFQLNDVIAVDPITNSFVLSDSNYRTAIGRVTSISDTIPGWFTVNPVQKVVDNLDYLPGGVGDTIYTSLTNPGELTTEPGGSQIYIKLRDNTSSVSYSTEPGPTAAGNVFQLNGVNVTVYAPGNKNSIVSSVNSVSAQTGVTASIAPVPSVVETNPALITSYYGGEPLLYAASSPATATINGVLVTFNITSSDPGYTDYARPAQMAQAINNASIPNIVASIESTNVLVIKNLSGGQINIVNGNNDINNTPFAGNNSGSGLLLSTPNSTDTHIKFLAVDARPINFLDVIGTPTLDFGLISVENGIKACGLYIEEGLRTATSTVVTNLAALYALSPLIGDQAYVINSADAQGNNVNQWSMWIYNGSTWVKTATQDSSSTDAKSIEAMVSYDSLNIVSIGEISTGRRVTLITVEVLEAFDTLATLNIGYQVNNPLVPPPVPAGLMSNAIIDLNVVGTYTTSTDILFGTDTEQGDVSIFATFNGNGSSVGNAQIIVSYV